MCVCATVDRICNACDTVLAVIHHHCLGRSCWPKILCAFNIVVYTSYVHVLTMKVASHSLLYMLRTVHNVFSHCVHKCFQSWSS